MDLYIQQSEKQSNTKIDLLRTYGLTLGDVINLNRLAIQAAEMSTQNLSGDVKIGASVMTINGNMYQGSNIESNSNYGQGVSAEDIAIYKAINEGQHQFKAICVHVKHLIKEDDIIPSGDQGPLTSKSLSLNQVNSTFANANLNNLSTPQNLNSPQLISPRLNQQLQQSEIYQVPELQRTTTPNGSQLQDIYRISKQPSISNNLNNNNSNNSMSQPKRYKSVFQMPNGNWRNNMLSTKNYHMLLISCKSESNFIIKTSQSMLINCPQPCIDHRIVTKDLMKQLMQPDVNSYKDIQFAAALWNLMDFNEETRHQIERLLVHDKQSKLKKLFGKRLRFKEPGIITKKYYGGFNRINYVTMQQIGHGIAEYLFEKFDRNDLANQGVVIGFDARYESFGLSNILTAVLKAYQIRVYCLDRYAIAPFVSYFAKKFKTILGIMVTGRDYPKNYSGLMIFNHEGSLIDKETSSSIERTINDYVLTQKYLIDLSPLFDYTAKKVKFKPDNFTDVTMKSYIQELEEKYLFNQRKTNKELEKLIFSSLHGPAFEYMKKIFANFGFLSPIIPENHQNMSHNFDSVISPNICLGKVIMKQQIRCFEKVDSGRYVITTDPIGQSFSVAENLSREFIDKNELQKQNGQNNGGQVKQSQNRDVYVYQSNEIAIILMEFILTNLQLKQTVVDQSQNIKEYIAVYENLKDKEILQNYCDLKNIKLLHNNEIILPLQENQKFLLKLNLEKQQFSFNLTQSPDALIASIILSQLLVQLQCDQKSLYHDYLMPILQKQLESSRYIEKSVVIVLAAQKNNKMRDVIQEMREYYQKYESVKIQLTSNQMKDGAQILQSIEISQKSDGKNLLKKLILLSLNVLSQSINQEEEKQSDEKNSDQIIQAQIQYKYINSQSCLVKLSYSIPIIKQDDNKTIQQCLDIKQIAIKFIEVAFGEIECQQVEKQNPQQSEGNSIQINVNNFNGNLGNKIKVMPLMVIL